MSIFGCVCGSQMVLENRLQDPTILCKKKLEWLDWEREAGAKYGAIEDGGRGWVTAIKERGYGYQKGGYAQRFPNPQH